MYKIDTPGATAANEFQAGNPLATPPIPATELGADWFTMIQRELVALVEGAGLTLTKGDDDQVYTATRLVAIAESYIRHTITAPRDLVFGDGVLFTDQFGVAGHDALTGNPVELRLLGKFQIACKSTDVVAEGRVLYWDDAAHELEIVAVGNHLVAAAMESKASGPAVIWARLNGNALFGF